MQRKSFLEIPSYDWMLSYKNHKLVHKLFKSYSHFYFFMRYKTRPEDSEIYPKEKSENKVIAPLIEKETQSTAKLNILEYWIDLIC